MFKHFKKKYVYVVFFNDGDNKKLLKIFKTFDDANNYLLYWNFHNSYEKKLTIEKKPCETYPKFDYMLYKNGGEG